MRKVLGVLLCGVLLIGLTGCGSSGNYNKEFEEEINLVKNQTMPFSATDKYSIGELLDNAFEDAYWDHFTGYLPEGDYTLISVKGTSKFDKKEYEVVYKVDTKKKSVLLEQTYIDGEKDCCVTDVYRDSYEDIKGE